MAALKISAMTALAGSQIADADSFEVLDSSASDNKRIILSELKKAIALFTPFALMATFEGAATNIYARYGTVLTNETPIVLPYDVTLVGMAASSKTSNTWSAEIHKALTLVAGALVTVTAATKAITSALTVDLTAGDELQIYINGTSVVNPVVTLFFARR